MPGTETAQRFLASAYDSVQAVLENLSRIRQLRKDETGDDMRGRLTANEEDLLRAAIVFTGAGLDAMLKQLIRDTLPTLLDYGNAQAHLTFERFAEDRLGTGEIADTKAIARYLTSDNPRDRLIDDYVYDLTGSSLQSADEVKRTAVALGLNMTNGRLRARIDGLKPLFEARNQVSHELDLQRLEKPGDRTRRTRSIGPTRDLCHDGLEVGQLIINGVGSLL
jgi:hypothetical protein